jgi:hypothetical protein
MHDKSDKKANKRLFKVTSYSRLQKFVIRFWRRKQKQHRKNDPDVQQNTQQLSLRSKEDLEPHQKYLKIP